MPTAEMLGSIEMSKSQVSFLELSLIVLEKRFVYSLDLSVFACEHGLNKIL